MNSASLSSSQGFDRAGSFGRLQAENSRVAFSVVLPATCIPVPVSHITSNSWFCPHICYFLWLLKHSLRTLAITLCPLESSRTMSSATPTKFFLPRKSTLTGHRDCERWAMFSQPRSPKYRVLENVCAYVGTSHLFLGRRRE